MSESEIVRTSGRRMSRQLQDAIDGVYGEDRQFTIRVMLESDPADSLGRILHALALELQLGDLRSADLFDRLDRERTAEIPDGPPIPPRTGIAYTFDPDGDAA